MEEERKKRVLYIKSIREVLEEREERFLSVYATKSTCAKREKFEEPCLLRTEFQRDRDKIIHGFAFRQLKYKTQVFLLPKSETLRTRLTHTIEVAQISRTVAKALMLNEDLTEAIALGHDLGHPPFGHASEKVLNEILLEGFSHSRQSLRIVERVEKSGKGLNLTLQVKEGILTHSGSNKPLVEKLFSNQPSTLEACIVRFADIIAYINHDIQDALACKIIQEEDLPNIAKKILGKTYTQRINTMVSSVIESSINKSKIEIEEVIVEAMQELKEFLEEKVYNHPLIIQEVNKAQRIIQHLFEHFLNQKEYLVLKLGYDDQIERLICDFICLLSDNEALALYEKIFIPKPLFFLWQDDKTL